MSSLTGNDGKPLFEAAFLDYLQQVELTCDIDAVPEGTVVFPNEPLVRVRGPLIQCQLLETPLVNILNFQSLIATKASRVCEAAQGDRVIEFGLRRAQGFDGALAASRAAYVGGCESTSNVLAGKLFGIPAAGDPRPQLGDDLRLRDGGFRGLRRGHAEQLHPARRHL